MLVVEDLGVRLSRRWIFRHLSFRVEPGQVLAVLGSNGSGKSTLLKAVAGLLSPSEGRVLRPGADPRRSLGYAALDLALYPTLSAREHLEWIGTLRGVAPRTDELLERVGLAETGSKLTQAFSSGMRARLKLALALQAEPLVLLLDEPSASLDASGRDIVKRIVHDQTQRGLVVLATNDPAEKEWASHELVLNC